MKLYNILFISESRTKAFEKVMRQVYNHLPDHVFRDMYSQEKQHEIIFDPNIGQQVQELTNNVLLKNPSLEDAIKKIREFEQQRESEWINTSWESKQAKQIKLHWNDLSSIKKEFFVKKYLGLNPHFAARSKDKHGYLDKVERILSSNTSSTEPVILLKRKDQNGYDIIGGNNRVFNSFLKKIIKSINLKLNDLDNPDFFKSVFDYLDNQNPFITINAFVGSTT
jgi:hypothetical protein